jgi:uncharacterized protein
LVTRSRLGGVAISFGTLPRLALGPVPRRNQRAIIGAFPPALPKAQGLPFGYEPLPVIKAIRPRQLWLLAGRDRQAPHAGTLSILRTLQKQRSDLAVVVFPNADHGLMEPISGPGGNRTGFSPKLFDVAAAWIVRRSLPGRDRMIVMPETR